MSIFWISEDIRAISFLLTSLQISLFNKGIKLDNTLPKDIKEICGIPDYKKMFVFCKNQYQFIRTCKSHKAGSDGVHVMAFDAFFSVQIFRFSCS